MIKPSTIYYLVSGNRIKMEYKTEKGLGNGGFRFDFCQDFDLVPDRNCYLEIKGMYVNPVGPFKRWVECSVKIAVYPTYSPNYDYDDGYSYHCRYKKSFWGGYYTTDVDKLIDKLLLQMSTYFEHNDS